MFSFISFTVHRSSFSASVRLETRAAARSSKEREASQKRSCSTGEPGAQVCMVGPAGGAGGAGGGGGGPAGAITAQFLALFVKRPVARSKLKAQLWWATQ